MADLHGCARWSPLDALDAVVDDVLDGQPDLILLPGDFLTERIPGGRPESMDRIASTLARLRAPLGVFASLGNHDYKDCSVAQANGYRESGVGPALEAVGIPDLSNRAVDLGSAWLVGADSQQGIGNSKVPDPRHDLDAAMEDVPEGASVILMAHEPDIFLEHDYLIALQVSGHLHGGQIAFGNWRPVSPSRYGSTLARGVVSLGERRLMTTVGLGYTALPIRFGAPPEWNMVRIASSE